MARAKRDKNGYFYEVVELKRAVGGKRRRKYIRAKTAAKLREKVAQFHADQDKGLAPVRTPGMPTMAALLREWLENEQKRGKIRPSTHTRYEMDIRNHIIPALGYILPPDLTYDHVQQFVDHVSANGRKPRKEGGTSGPLSPQTVRRIMTPLLQALDAAKRRGLVRENVARDVELPEAKAPDLYQLTPDEIRRFLDIVRGDRFEALYWLAVLGIREGELLALRWEYINIEARTIKVAGGSQRVRQAEGKSKIERVPTKTRRGYRIIRLPLEWCNIILAHLERQDEERQRADWQENNLVFPSTIGTSMEAQNLVNRYFKPALTRAGLPSEKIRFHDLRHGAASMFIALGYDARTVADILGHSSPDFTLRQYAHSFEEVRDRAVADVGALLTGDERVLEMPRRKQEQGR